MSLLDFENRWPENVPGRFYVSNQCLDCDLCRQMAPSIFGRNDERGYSYVKRQPETESELSVVLEAAEGCCVETIHDDGRAFDWQATPARPEQNYSKAVKEVSFPDGTPEALSEMKPLAERKDRSANPWWRFW